MQTNRVPPRRILRTLSAVACLTYAVACGSDSASAPTQDDVARAADVFAHLADSVSRTRGDSATGSAYASLADAMRRGGRVTPVVIAIDGVPTTYLAIAQQTDADITCGLSICSAIKYSTTLRTLLAWQQSDPRRVVQLSSQADADPIRAYVVPVFVPFPGTSASLIYLDGTGAAFFGTSGTQKFGVTTSTTACSGSSNGPVIMIFPQPPSCTEASFAIAFDGKAETSSFLFAPGSARFSHTIAMAAQPVLGARLQLFALLPPLPPITVTPSASLPAALSAKVDSLVTLTLSITNPGSAPVTVGFASGQHYDFTVSDASGAVVWRWGMGMMFTQATSTEIIPAGGALTWTAQWQPAQKGSYVAQGSLVSTSHRADAKVAFTAP